MASSIRGGVAARVGLPVGIAKTYESSIYGSVNVYKLQLEKDLVGVIAVELTMAK